MIIEKVVGNVWATRKEESLNGFKLLVIKPIDYYHEKEENTFVAVDSVGAGIGEQVLVVRGSSARKVLENREVPVDATVIGIIDEIERIIKRVLEN
ncbi:putative carboxysome-like ethanolaminosome structural protein, ethanolamine utilization protein [[Clostridium] ultunense Esp]|uniref:Putative carboxysome-like ethanolaminosome structural protein, ethanolamine utilization protein n=1 Tax=[Clostridium] ultunense Esp TaxID=1288971 RepID=M1ZIY7_9FIRM|nr:EutN/CcmL family microcompartment protein [Schnuerera ultunensis]CCQ93937.1 putative carboxysome-like ethanolaminosome structural protein, ethanolamine utilization protein [[Clostridium] ultunense Esp]SHD77347.1 putative carboxysome-like ethanolaminosome structural protein, ethanolamine utilization protein [[Clostridium] ultunense Esp]